MTERKLPKIDDLGWPFLLREFNKSERLRAFHRIRARLGPDEWRILGRVWVHNESLYQDDDVIRALFAEDRLADPNRPTMMNDAERAAYEALPPRVTVYRGCWAGNLRGWSWTLSYGKAQWFADRTPMDGQPIVVAGTVAAADVVAYLARRQEEEIVVDPHRVRETRARRLPPQRPDPERVAFQRIHSGHAEPLPLEQKVVSWIATGTRAGWTIGELDAYAAALCQIHDELGFSEKAASWRSRRLLLAHPELQREAALKVQM